MEYNMKRILEIFSDCDSFSLTYSNNINKISKTEKERLLKSRVDDEKYRLKRYYDKIQENEENLLDFDFLFNEILTECKEFNKNSLKKPYKNGSPFIADHVGKDTKYSEPFNLIWMMYHNIQHALMSIDNLKNIDIENEDYFNIDCIENTILQNNLIKYEFTHQTHCTSGPLQLVYYFKLNNETKKWLLQFEDDYDIIKSGYEDLAIYKENNLKFSSCTHEGFNSLDSFYKINY